MDNLNQNVPAKRVKTNGKFTLLYANQLPEQSGSHWLIDEILPYTGLACIYGPSGVGKSFFSLGIAAALGIGERWFTRDPDITNVYYLALEGQAGMKSRTSAWEKVHDMMFPGYVSFVLDKFSLRSDVDSLAKLINQNSNLDLSKPVVFIDTLNRAASGADENSSSEMGKILAGASRLQALIGGLVVLIHHPGKDESRGLRGHSSLYAAMDTIIEVSQEGNRKWWKLVKSKDGRSGISYPFELETVHLGEDAFGKAITSCAVIETGGLIPPKPTQPNGNNQRVILAAFTEMQAQQRIQSIATEQAWPDGIAFDYAVDHLNSLLGTVDKNHRKSRAKEALEGLVKKGFLNLDGELLTLAEHGGAS